MKRHTWKAFVVMAALFTVSAVQPAVARAGLLADTWYAIFGPPGTPYYPGVYTSYYGPTYYTGYSGYYSAGYGSVCCRPTPVCRPCTPCPTVCDPCASACATPCNPCSPCAGGACATSGSSAPPQTFKKPGTMNEEPPQPDSKFKSRDDSKKFRPTDKSKLNGTDGKKSKFPTPAGEGDGNEGTGKTAVQRKALKPATKDPNDGTPGPVIRQKKPVPAKTPLEKSDKDKKKEVPALIRPNFDDKIAWKPALPRTRLIINARVSHPQLSRTVVDPNAGWKPVRNDTRVVRK